jgi:hypothetical protein
VQADAHTLAVEQMRLGDRFRDAIGALLRAASGGRLLDELAADR